MFKLLIMKMIFGDNDGHMKPKYVLNLRKFNPTGDGTPARCVRSIDVTPRPQQLFVDFSSILYCTIEGNAL